MIELTMQIEIEKEKTEVISQPYEYFDAQVSFAKKISEITGETLEESMLEYTDLYNSLTNKPYGEEEEKGKYLPIWREYIEKIQNLSNSNDISKVTYNLFLQQECSKILIENDNNDGSNAFGCFKIDYGDYNKQREQIKLHFSPSRKDLLKSEYEEKHGDLSSKYLLQRTEEFRAMIRYIHDNQRLFEGAKYLKSSTWLQNIPNYQRLFPNKYSSNENRLKKEKNFLGLWGQFVKWDLTANTEIYNKFKEHLDKADTLQDAINAFPYPVYELLVPLEELFEMYEIR
jgi:hypothetical protein